MIHSLRLVLVGLGLAASLLVGLLLAGAWGGATAPPLPAAQAAQGLAPTSCVALHEDLESGTLGVFLDGGLIHWGVACYNGCKAQASYPARLLGAGDRPAGNQSAVLFTPNAFQVPLTATQVLYSFRFGLYYDPPDLLRFIAYEGYLSGPIGGSSMSGEHTYTYDVSQWAGRSVAPSFDARLQYGGGMSTALATLDDVLVQYSAPGCPPLPPADSHADTHPHAPRGHVRGCAPAAPLLFLCRMPGRARDHDRVQLWRAG